MKIVVFGAGAIGSFFGGMLSFENKVCLVARKSHVDSIKNDGLKITGKTNFVAKVDAVDSAKKLDFIPDLIVFTVKSFDTIDGVKQIRSIMDENTLFLSIQNGLDNIKKISEYVGNDDIASCVTTNGVIFQNPGVIEHTGVGDTFLGMLNKKNDPRLLNVLKLLNQAGINSDLSNDIQKDIWIKGIINSCINPVTAFFDCKNGYILKNPVLSRILNKICEESTVVAKSNGIDVTFEEMLQKTKNVIKCTEENFSSMLQSVKKNKRTEIDSINGEIVRIGLENEKDVFINQVLVYLIKNRF